MAESRTDKIICYGDSQTAGFSWGERLPALLTSVNQAVGRGISGQCAGSVAIRQGGIILTTTADCTIAASTEPVLVPVLADHLPVNIRWNASSMDMLLGGIRGTVTISQVDAENGIAAWSNPKGTGTAIFTPKTAPATPVDVPSGTAFVSQDVQDNPGWGNYVHIFWVGGNDSAYAGNTRVTGIVSAAQAVVDRLKTFVDEPKFLVASRTARSTDVEGTEGYATAVAQRDALAEAFPDNAIDIWGHVKTNGLDILGITPTEADLTALAGGGVPPSLTGGDGLHYSTQTREKVLAPFIASELVARGWATATEGEVPVADYTKTTWVNDQAPDLDATHLNNLETGVSAALEAAGAASQAVADVREDMSGKADTTALTDGLAKKVDVKGADNKNSVYGISNGGSLYMYPTGVSTVAASTVAMRGSNGVLKVGAPADADHATTKKYVDDAVTAARGAIPDVSALAKTADVPTKADFDALAARVTALETPAAPEE